MRGPLKAGRTLLRDHKIYNQNINETMDDTTISQPVDKLTRADTGEKLHTETIDKTNRPDESRQESCQNANRSVFMTLRAESSNVNH